MHLVSGVQCLDGQGVYGLFGITRLGPRAVGGGAQGNLSREAMAAQPLL